MRTVPESGMWTVAPSINEEHPIQGARERMTIFFMLRCSKGMAGLPWRRCRSGAEAHTLSLQPSTEKPAMPAETRKHPWFKYREIHDALMRLSDRDLADIGVKRGDIPVIARRGAGLASKPLLAMG
jgi:uncharacterized protein YjiS (DUF1127 family)